MSVAEHLKLCSEHSRSRIMTLADFNRGPYFDPPSDRKVWKNRLSIQDKGNLRGAVDLLRGYEFGQLCKKGRVVVYGIKPEIRRHYRRRGLPSFMEEVKDALFPTDVLKAFEVTLHMTPDEVRAFYADAPWNRMRHKIYPNRIFDPKTGKMRGLSEATLFTYYMSSAPMTFGIVTSDRPIIDEIRGRLGKTAPAKAFSEDQVTGNRTLRGSVGSPFFGPNAARNQMFLNAAHASSDPESAYREAQVLARFIDSRVNDWKFF